MEDLSNILIHLVAGLCLLTSIHFWYLAIKDLLVVAGSVSKEYKEGSDYLMFNPLNAFFIPEELDGKGLRARERVIGAILKTALFGIIPILVWL